MPILFVLIAASLWASIGPASQFALNEGMPAADVAFWRGTIAGSLFLLHALLTRSLRVELADLPKMILFGLFGAGLLELSNLFAIQKGGSAFAAIMLYTAPAWVALYSWGLKKESVGPAKALALGLTLAGVVGVALAGRAEFRFEPDAIVWGILSGMSYASFFVAGKVFLAKYPSQTVFAIAFPVASIGLAPFANFESISSVSLAATSYLGIAATYVAYYVYGLGLKRIDPTRASIIASCEPIIAAALAWWIWQERLNPWGYVFGALVIAGIGMIIWSEKRPAKRPPLSSQQGGSSVPSTVGTEAP